MQYILTPTVRRHLRDLIKIVSLATGVPVLLEGDTSVGKTSLINYLAKCTGNVCSRVNNHEHTDIQEYIGTYVADSNGKLVFKEGKRMSGMFAINYVNLLPYLSFWQVFYASVCEKGTGLFWMS